MRSFGHCGHGQRYGKGILGVMSLVVSDSDCYWVSGFLLSLELVLDSEIYIFFSTT